MAKFVLFQMFFSIMFGLCASACGGEADGVGSGKAPAKSNTSSNCQEFTNKYGVVMSLCCDPGERIAKKYDCGAGSQEVTFGCEPVSGGMSCTFHAANAGMEHACPEGMSCQDCMSARVDGQAAMCEG